MNVFELAQAERQRQIDEKGYTAESDDKYTTGELADAASCYAKEVGDRAAGMPLDEAGVPSMWPWADHTWDPKQKPKQMIIKAMALLAAEYDRVERK